MYDPEKLASLAILGLIYSYRKAERFARTIRYDAMFPEARCRYGLQYPSKSYPRYIVQGKISEDYLNAILKSIWKEIRDFTLIKSIFGDSIEFVIDGTGLSTRWLRLIRRKGEPMLVHESTKMYYNVDINLNAIIRIFVPQGNFTIREVVDFLTIPVPNSFGYLDPEFASKDAVSTLKARLFGYALKHRSGRVEYFCKEGKCVGGYSRRKLGEIPPGNFELRKVRIMAARPSNRVKEVVAKAGIRHNVLSLFRWLELPRKFRSILLPVGRYDVSLFAVDGRSSGDSTTSLNNMHINNIAPIDSGLIIYTSPIIIT